MHVNPLGRNENHNPPGIKPPKPESLPKPQPLSEPLPRQMSGKLSSERSPSSVLRILGLNQEWELLTPEQEKVAQDIYKLLEGLHGRERRNVAAKLVRGSPLPPAYHLKEETLYCPGGKEISLSPPSKRTVSNSDAKSKALTALTYKNSDRSILSSEEAKQLVNFIENELKIKPESYLSGKDSVYLRREETHLPCSLLFGKKFNGELHCYIMAKTGITEKVDKLTGELKPNRVIGEGKYKHVRVAIQYPMEENQQPELFASITLKMQEQEANEVDILTELGFVEKMYGRAQLASVQYTSKDEISDKFNYIMPLASGELLDLVFDESGRWFEDSPEAASERRTVVSSLLETASRMYQNGIACRDLKPENVLIARDHKGSPYALIHDLGMGTDLKTVGTGTGTPEYVPPEVVDTTLTKELRGTAEKHDIYSMAVTLWQTFHIEEGPSFPPWIRDVLRPRIKGSNELINASLYDYADSWENIDPSALTSLEKIIYHATHWNFKERPTMEELRQQVNNLSDEDLMPTFS